MNKEAINKKVYLKTYGCQMNVRDSEVLCGLLVKAGYEIVLDLKQAGIAIINTCAVREHAEQRVFSQIGILEKSRTKNKKPNIIGIVGCMAQNLKENIFQKAAGVDFICGPQDIYKIPGIINDLLKNKGLYEKKVWETDSKSRPEEIYHTGFFADSNHAYVVISEGCSNYCSYCVVPFVRGELRHRKHNDILDEIKQALDKGITRIVLLGQNVNSYGSDGVDFVALLKLSDKLEGLKELSFMTSHPKDTTIKLFEAMAECQKLRKWLHLPVQSGSDKILKAMNRGYTRKVYLDLIADYRKIVKKGNLTSDIIVGFPGETERDFLDTCELVKEAQFNAAYIFKYSPRPNTEAIKLGDDISRTDKERRHKQVLDLQRGISNKTR